MIDAIKSLLVDPLTRKRIEALADQADARLDWIEKRSQAVERIRTGLGSGQDIPFAAIQSLAFLPEGSTGYVFAPGTVAYREPLNAAQVKLTGAMDKGAEYDVSHHSDADEHIAVESGLMAVTTYHGSDTVVTTLFPGCSMTVPAGTPHRLYAEENLTFVSTFTKIDETS